jgi:DNA adenine methylase
MEESQQTLLRRIGQNVSALRKARELSQDELAALLGVDRKNISRIERGRVNVTVETLRRFSHALSTDISVLTARASELHPLQRFTPAERAVLLRAVHIVARRFSPQARSSSSKKRPRAREPRV